jgi:hypothetical protein
VSTLVDTLVDKCVVVDVWRWRKKNRCVATDCVAKTACPGLGLAHGSELWGMQWGIGDLCGGQAAWERHRGLSSASI